MAPTSSTSTRRTSIRRRGGVLPANFLRPYRGYGGIGVRQNTGETDYNSLQVQLNRRYIKGLQFALAYTLAKGYDTRVTSPYVAADQDWFWRAPTGGTQLHNLTISYTWDVPDGSKLWDNALTRGALDGWQLSGNTAFVSGDWVGRGLLDDGQLRLLRRRRRRSYRPDGDRSDERRQSGSESRWHGLVPEPGGVRASVGPAGSRQRPGAVLPAAVDQEHRPVVVQELPDGRRRRIQIRWEIYNLFNTVNWSGIDTTAQFNPAGRAGDTPTSTSARRRRRATRASCRARSASPSSRRHKHGPAPVRPGYHFAGRVPRRLPGVG